MRIIKLSTEIFDEVDKVNVFFEGNSEEDLRSTNPPGKFLITDGRIAEGGLEIGEPLLFSYVADVLYTAEAASGRRINEDEWSEDYPFYFLVNIETLLPAKASLYDIEEELHQSGEKKSLVQSQGWPIIPDSSFAERLWRSLRETNRKPV